VQFDDRSPFYTLALARYLGHPATITLTRELARVTREQLFERPVFFIRPLGFIVPTAARRISYDDSLAFEAVHEAIYRDHGARSWPASRHTWAPRPVPRSKPSWPTTPAPSTPAS
jgi:predicted ATPase